MKAVLPLAVMFGVAVLGGAQTVAPAVGMHADTMTRDGNGTHLRGNVALAIGGPVWVIADEADVTGDANEIELRGTVRLRTSPRR